jgi:hypothetical protein
MGPCCAASVCVRPADRPFQVKQRSIKFDDENLARELNGESHPRGRSILIAEGTESTRSPFRDRSTIGDRSVSSD